MQNLAMKAGEGDLAPYQILWDGVEVQLSVDSAGRIFIQGRDQGIDVDPSPGTGQTLHLLINGRSIRLEHLQRTEEGDLLLRINSMRYCLPIKNKRELLLASIQGAGTKDRKQTALKAPMPGLVLRILVTEGQVLQAGDPILVLESMKMENVLRAQSDSTVISIVIQPGEAVEKGQILVKFS
ncbi:MAG: acetyl-CoA carboxylase biotin carboxyl carrier protein subunit [Bacteroidota bacterium]